MINYDIILNEIGAMTHPQWVQLAILASISILPGCHMAAMVFFGYNQGHTCSVPKDSIIQECNITWTPQHNKLYIPWNREANTPDNCLLYTYVNVNCTFWNITDTYNVTDATMPSIKECTSWIYDTSVLKTTVTGDFDLVCDKKQQARFSQAIFMLGVALGTSVWGQISDRFGRKAAVATPLIIGSGIGIATAYSRSFTLFTVLRFLIGFTIFPTFSCAYVLGIEIVKQQDKVLLSQVVNSMYPVGICILPLIAYFTLEWRKLQLWISVPGVMLFLMTWFVFESPRWLISSKKYDKAYKIIENFVKHGKNSQSQEAEKLQRLAKIQTEKGVNDQHENKGLVCDNIEISTKKVKENTIIDVLKLPNMRKKSFVLFYNWMVCSIVYYGLTLNSADLGGNIFLNLFLSAVVEIPALFLSVPMIQRWGRRHSLTSTLLCSGVTCVSIVLAPKGLVTLAVTLSTLGKFMIAISFSAIYIYTTDIYPTPVRNVGLGVCSSWARIGGMLAPFIAMLDVIGFAIPYVAFGLLAVIGALLALLLPETRGKKIPETLQEAEQFGKQYEGILAFLCNNGEREDDKTEA